MNKLDKIRQLLLALLATLIVFPSVALDYEGYKYEDVLYDLFNYDIKDGNHTCVVHRGRFVSESAGWRSPIHGASGRISLPASFIGLGNYRYELTDISEGSFASYTKVTDIVIPCTVRSIGDYAFINCNKLKSVLFNGHFVTIHNPYDQLETIGVSAFEGCTSLKSVILPPSVTYVGDGAFYECTGLVKSAYPSTIKNPFSNGVAIEYDPDFSRYVDGSIYSWDTDTLYYLTLESFEAVIPRTVKAIKDNAIKGCTYLEKYGLKLMSSVPPEVSEEAFDKDMFSKVTLKVPSQYAESYRNHPVWKKFSNMEVFVLPELFVEHDSIVMVEGEIREINIISSALSGEDELTFVSVNKNVAEVVSGDLRSVKIKANSAGTGLIRVLAFAQDEDLVAEINVRVVSEPTIVIRNSESVIKSDEFGVGRNLRLYAELLEVVDDSDVVWTSSNEEVATVNPKGFVNGVSECAVFGVSEGVTDIRATYHGASAEVHLKCTEPSIRIKPSGIYQLLVGRTEQLTAVKTFIEDSLKVKWEASAPVVIDDNGLVRAYAPGFATVCATCSRWKDYMNISCFYEPVLTFGRDSIDMRKEQSIRLEDLGVNIENPNGLDYILTWRNTTGRVMISGNEISARYEGDDTICAQISYILNGERVFDKYYCKVHVGPKLQPSILIDPEFIRIEQSSSYSLKVTLKDIDEGSKITWTSSNVKVATVDNQGNVVGVSEGNATITASCAGYKATTFVMVYCLHPAISIVPNNVRLQEGQTCDLKATLTDIDESEKITWASSNEKVATVDDQGRVVAITTGEAIITASCAGYTASASVEVYRLYPAVSIVPSEVILQKGKTQTLKAVLTDIPNGTTVNWSSENTSVVTVNSKGVITAVSKGAAIVKATCNGVYGECFVEVLDPSPVVVYDATLVSTDGFKVNWLSSKEYTSYILTATFEYSSGNNTSELVFDDKYPDNEVISEGVMINNSTTKSISYTITGVNEYGMYSAPSKTIRVRLASELCPPKVLQPSNNDISGELDIQWEPHSSALGARLYVDAISDGKYKMVYDEDMSDRKSVTIKLDTSSFSMLRYYMRSYNYHGELSDVSNYIILNAQNSIESVNGDALAPEVVTDGSKLIIRNVAPNADIHIFNLEGVDVYQGDIDNIRLERGFYIVVIGNTIHKIVI